MSTTRFVIATGFIKRARGLLGTKKSWGAGNTVMLFPSCKSVHTVGMSYPLDIAFANGQGVVLKSERGVKPGCMRCCAHAAFVLERPSSGEAWPETGERLSLILP